MPQFPPRASPPGLLTTAGYASVEPLPQITKATHSSLEKQERGKQITSLHCLAVEFDRWGLHFYHTCGENALPTHTHTYTYTHLGMDGRPSHRLAKLFEGVHRSVGRFGHGVGAAFLLFNNVGSAESAARVVGHVGTAEPGYCQYQGFLRILKL